ncbi:hypothetical protein HYU10_02205 [Candidatus Woesearchaeota archaeon]|nr:hypothetical protein [Candidatus Woesearchaeota archaeon]
MARPINAAKGLVKIIAYLAACIMPGLLVDLLVHFIFGDSLLDSHYDIGFGTLLKSLLWTIVIIIVLFIVVLTAAKGEDNWKFKKIKGKYKVVLMNMAKVRLNKAVNVTDQGKDVWIKRLVAPDKLTEILKENIVLLFSLSNYMKRLYIFYVKMHQVTTARRISAQMMGYIGHHVDVKELENEIYKCRTGGDIHNPTGGSVSVGWFKANTELCNAINNAADFLREYTSTIKEPVVGGRTPDYRRFASLALNHAQEIERAYKIIETSYQYLQERAKAYGSHQVIKAWRYVVLDECNPCGEYEHYYKFVKRGTSLIVPPRNGRSRSAEEELEVNIYGEVLKDKHDEMPARRVQDPREIYDMRNPMVEFGYILRDWEGFIRDMRFGEYKYYSRSVFDYINALTTKPGDPRRLGRNQFFEMEKVDNDYVDDRNIPKTIGYKGAQRPAFDRMAMVNTGKMDYIGRRDYNQLITDIKNDSKKILYPAVSSLGISLYIPAVTRRDVSGVKAVQTYLNRWVRDRGVTIETPSKAKEAIGSLGEMVEKQEGQ